MSNNSVEKFDYTAIAGSRAKIEASLESALKALKTGAEAIDAGFGSNGTAMTGGSSNAISSKWSAMEDAINGFRTYLNQTLDNVGTASQSNQALEDMATQLFGGTANHE